MSDDVFLRKHLDHEGRRAELRQIEAGLAESPFPPQLVIENTSHCNMKCIHCAHREMTRPRMHMERALWDKLVAEVGREAPQCELWPTFYGEALILKDELWDRLDHAARVGCANLVLNSNGALLGRFGNIDRVLQSPLKRFIVSLDGFTAETFEKIRVNGKRDAIFQAVEELCRKRRERGQVYPTVTAQFSVMKENAGEQQAFVAHWKAAGAEVKLRPMLEWGNTGVVSTGTIEHGGTFRIACPWGINTAAIHADGSMVCCAVDYAGRLIAGNTREHTIRELWAVLGEKVRRPHREHRWADLPEMCKTCGDWQTAGAHYEAEQVPGTRPFWYYGKDEAEPERQAG